MPYLALTRDAEGLRWGELEEALREEARAVWELKKSGRLREIWFTEGARDAILLLDAPSEAEARASLDSLPLVRGGYIRYELLALVAYDGFERLFSEPGPPPSD